MAEGTFSLQNIFKTVAKFATVAVVGGLVGEALFLTLGHFNVGGMALMNTISDPINRAYDALGVTDLMFALNDFLGGSAETAVATFNNTNLTDDMLAPSNA